MEINEKILKAIQEDLPAATAGELKKFIENANANQIALDDTIKTLQDVVAQRAELVAKQATFNEASNKLAAAELKLVEAEQKTRSFDLAMRDEQIKQRDFVITKFEMFLANLTKNARAIELISENRNVPVYEPYAGGGGHHSTRSELTTGTRETIEQKD